MFRSVLGLITVGLVGLRLIVARPSLPPPIGENASLLQTEFNRICAEDKGGHLTIKAGTYVFSNTSLEITSEGLNASNMSCQNQVVNIMGSLVGFDRFKIVHVTHDWVFTGYTIGSMNISGNTGNVQCNIYIVHFWPN